MNLRKLFGVLQDREVDFIVIGGVAARAHGSARVTQDVDVCYSRTTANLERLVLALKPLKPYLRGAPPGLPFDWSIAILRAGLNFTLTTTAGDIDLLGEVVGGGKYEDLEPHTIKVRVYDRDLLVLDLPWLIKTKRAAGRPRDLEAVAELMAIQEETAKRRDD
jgi:hypothetical protein